MSDFIARLDALVSGTVSNDSARFHEVWPALVEVVAEAHKLEIIVGGPLAAALQRLRASVGEGG